MLLIRFTLFLYLVSCSTINNVSNHSDITRGPASVSVDYQNNIPKTVTLKPIINSVTLCNKKFNTIEWVTDHKNFVVKNKSYKNGSLTYFFPESVNPIGINLSETVELQHLQNKITLQYPLLPSIPILENESKDGICTFLNKNISTINNSLSKKIISQNFEINFNNKIINLKSLGSNKISPDLSQFAKNSFTPRPLMIVYDDLYAEDLVPLKNSLESHNISVIMQPLSTLPGLGLNSPVPLECSGSYFSECYASLPNQDYITNDFIRSLIGFNNSEKFPTTNYNVPFIPGLIRAHIRKMLKEKNLGYTFLVGSPKKIAPFYVSEQHYHENIPNMPSTYIHSDLFYMVPNGALSLKKFLNFDLITNWLWSCKSNKTHIVSLKKWCEDDDTRYWPEPALSAYRPGIYAPTSLVFNYESTNGTLLKSANFENMVAVGRLPTQELLFGKKDPVVRDYAEKVEEWFDALPSMKNNSFATYGGTTSDTWIFQQADTTSFNATYGENSKVYASEFFVPLSHCKGCSYIPGDEVLPEIAEQRTRVAWLLNGHGAKDKIQAPFANGNIESHFHAENRYRLGGLDIKKILFKFPDFNTLKILENSETIIGHVFANSCTASDFLFSGSNEIETIFTKKFNTNQKTFAEQLISLPHAGAMNTLINSDVGFGYSDNLFNQYFMAAVDSTWNNCMGYVGDAYKKTIANLIKDNQLLFQIYNRQFLGLPVNFIAKPPSKCDEIFGVTR